MKPNEERARLFEELYPLDRLEMSSNSISNMFNPIKIYLVTIHAITIVLVIILFFNINSANKSLTPVQEYIEYESQREYASDETYSNFSGPPTPEQELGMNWCSVSNTRNHKIFINTNNIPASFFKVTREELERAGSSLHNIAELTGGGYVATLGVYHELHCVRQLRFYLSKERYYPHLTQAEATYLQHHLGRVNPR
ncbi:hypothetical protein F4777DRAFT_601121 [Nemania sp. FL0916]|nr:hypothetical protein F4777DRAFT_601121 [Nemania sp. FL0916]